MPNKCAKITTNQKWYDDPTATIGHRCIRIVATPTNGTKINTNKIADHVLKFLRKNRRHFHPIKKPMVTFKLNGNWVDISVNVPSENTSKIIDLLNDLNDGLYSGIVETGRFLRR